MKAFPNTASFPLREDGMDLRDYFAAKALQGLLANPKLQEQILKTGGATGGWISESSYGFADEMMKVRKNDHIHN